ncbi:piggyBac transposable element-derived protein 2-like [Bradysia coprophila]|uniref:piggyBac transposable element-derived protein 2-like n=1 Tax=Bradysia coprophila TaxID=38358 RepID=UPI00187DBE8D|nr:piggyBac transposable element-derived protein 2-like [Bradysia coprophila]
MDYSSDSDQNTDYEYVCLHLPSVDAASSGEEADREIFSLSVKKTKTRKIKPSTKRKPQSLVDEPSSKRKCLRNRGGTGVVSVKKTKTRKNIASTLKRVRKRTQQKTVKPVRKTATNRAKSKKDSKKKVTWIDGDFEKTTKFPVFSQRYNKYENLSPTDLFETFFADELWQHIQMETTKYALFLNCPDPKITIPELKCFFGILILSGYNRLPGKKFFWDKGADMGNRLVSESMRRDRFVQIMRYIHWADNSQASDTDKLWKIRPVVAMLQKKFLNNFVPTEYMNYDESMVKYYGMNSMKQCIKEKPVPFGYKVWCLNAANGYLAQFEIYQGKKTVNGMDDYSQKYGKSTAPLVHMLDLLPEKDLPYQLFTDNLFTSFNLLTDMRKRGYGVTGTMRINRIPKDIPLPDKKLMEKKGRGAFVSKISKEDGVIVVRWTDNAVVSVASTTYGVQPLNSTLRYSKEEKRKIDVEQPHLIAMYNKYMGGTDRMDQDLARNRIGIRGKKWYWPLLTWLIDAAVQNAWTLYKCTGKKATSLQFRRDIANTYLKRYGVAPKQTGRPSSSKQVHNVETRYDKINHLVQSTPNKRRRRCALEGCKSSVRTECKKCNRGLCIDCFIPYHTKQ